MSTYSYYIHRFFKIIKHILKNFRLNESMISKETNISEKQMIYCMIFIDLYAKLSINDIIL